MRTYECIFIVHPETVGEELDAVIEKYQDVLTSQGANVLKIDNWGMKTLSYPVKKQNQGTYVLVIFDGQPTIIAEFERRMRIDDKVIKFQTVLLEGGYEAASETPQTETAPAEVDKVATAADADEA